MYRDAVSSDPENADGYVGLGEALDAQHRAAEAERALRKAVEVEPTYWGAQTALGTFLFRHGRTSAAIATYRRVTELIPASPLGFNNLGAARTPVPAPSTTSSDATRMRRGCSPVRPSSPRRITASGATSPMRYGRSRRPGRGA